MTLFEETLIPKARESLQATESGFTGGEIDFNNIIDAERVLLEFRLSLERARTDRWLADVRLRAFIGEPGEPLPTNSSEGNNP